jgi:catechol 2,3-dioxygenase-like lactoylglutathione lyase family enzyme
MEVTMTKARKILKTVSVCAVLATLGAAATQDETATAPHFTGVIAFLYYEDFERASRFYGEALGLSKTYDRDGVEVFAVTPSASVGIIDIRRRGPNAQVTPGDKSAGMSFIVDELDHVDAWYERLKDAGVDAEAPSDGTETPVRSVQFSDPEGYPMEVFAWLPER